MKKSLLLGCTTLLACSVSTALSAASIDTNHQYAYSENAGWLNFSATGSNVVVLKDHLEGYVWGENVGWIRLGTHTTGGTHTYANDAAGTYGVNRDSSSGDLSGFAWSENVGWINFGATNGNAKLSIAGEFTGAVWAENGGWIKLNGTAQNSATYQLKSLSLNTAPSITLPSVPSVAENQTNVAIANSIQITDSDSDDQTLTLTITGGTVSISTSGLNLIFTTGDGSDDSSMVFSGTIADINSALDGMTFTPTANTVGAASIQIQTNDGNTGTADETLSFSVSDVDPTIANASAFIEENSANGTTVTTVSSSADDNGLNFAITAGNTNNAFAIDASSGVITVADSNQLDTETTPDFSLTVSVDDEDNDSTADSTATISITVSNVNDNSPVFSSANTADVVEGATTVITAVATDADTTDTVTFSLNGGKDADKFAITSAGVLTFKAAPDFETPTDSDSNNIYEVIVRASDGSSNTDQTITVTVTDIDDTALSLTNQSFPVPLNAANNRVIGVLVATGGANNAGATSFTITAGNDASAFAITNQGSLSLANSTALTVGSQALTIEASDGSNTTTATVTLFVTDGAQLSSDIDSDGNGITDLLEQTFGTLDSDGDSIPDALEDLLGFDVDPTTDTDGDGMPDVAEVLVGRDPKIDDNTASGSPVISVANSPLNLAAKGSLSVFSLTELGVSATDDGSAVTPVAYLKNAACATAVPYNYQTVCNIVPSSGVTSGVNEMWFLFTDASGNWGRNEQILNLLPQIDFERNRILSGDAGNGSLTTRLVLSGDTVLGTAFTVPFTLSGSAQNPSDHDLVAGQFAFQANARESDPITVTLGNAPTDGQELVLSLDSSNAVFNQSGVAIDTASQFVTAGSKLSQTITITQDRVYPPNLSNLKGTQGSSSGLLFDKTQGNVTLSFDIIDPDGGTYSYSWANSNNALLLASGDALSNSTDAAPVLDLSTLTAGRFFIEVEVTDSTATNKPASKLNIMLAVSGVTLSDTADTDGDGKTDLSEGFGDDDGDGIANYLDAFDTQANVLPTESGALVKVAPGLRMMLGSTSDGSSLTISLADLAAKGNNGESTTNSDLPDVELSAIFDYQIEGLEVPSDPNAAGNSIAVVLPLTDSLTENTAFNKYDAVNGWKAYVVDANNTIEWAAFENGVTGNCPDTDSSDYTSDLSQIVGKNCLKVTLQDGGSNDADGVVDGRIVDPLGVGEASTSTATATNSSSGGGGSVSWFSLLLLFGVGLARRLMWFRKQR